MHVCSRHPVPCVALALACAVLSPAARVATAWAGDGQEGAGRFSVSGEVDVVSRYVWRAIAYSEGLVVQPSATLALGPAELNLWANLDPALPGSERLTEVDATLAWSLDLGVVELIPSFMAYTYPRLGEANTGELQLEVRRGLPGGSAAFARHALDVIDYPGATFTFAGLDREWTFAGGGSISLATQVGRGSQRFSDTYLAGAPAYGVAGLAASWTIPLRRGWALRSHVDWLEVVDGEARALLPSHAPLTVGIALGRL